MKLTPQQRGRIAKREGMRFESLFERQCHKQGLTATRIPDGCKQLGARKLVRVKSPFDWIVTRPACGSTALLDSKSFDRARIMPSDVDANQFEKLAGHHFGATVAGYVVWFRQVDRVVFYAVPKLQHMLISGKGFDWSEGQVLGECEKFQPAQMFQNKGVN